MHLKEYQSQAEKTIQKSKVDSSLDNYIHYLGIVGEVGSVVSELKKHVRDNEGYIFYKERLQEELGDVLWYLSTIATLNGIDLEEIAKQNLRKTNERFGTIDSNFYKVYDIDYPKNEQFPREFEIIFKSEIKNFKKTITITDNQGKKIGNQLNDNSYKEDGYRYHDIFHFGYVAYLGWSPVIRSLMNLKRKTKKAIDETEDGGRAKIIEELITLYIYSESKKSSLFKYTQSVDSSILSIIKQLVQGIEVRDCSTKQWESAIIGSYKVYRELIKNEGGRVFVSIKNRKLLYIGKN